MAFSFLLLNMFLVILVSIGFYNNLNDYNLYCDISYKQHLDLLDSNIKQNNQGIKELKLQMVKSFNLMQEQHLQLQENQHIINDKIIISTE